MLQKKKFLFTLLTLMLFISASAQAALDPAVATAITSIQTDSASLFSTMWPTIATVLGTFVIIRLFKRAGNKI